MDPAWLSIEYFDWDETVSRDYIFHPFLYNHLGGVTVGHIYSVDSYRNGPTNDYQAIYDIIVPEDNTLRLNDGVKIYFTPGTKLISYGTTDALGHMGTIYLLNNQNGKNNGITINGNLVIKNGGTITFT